jgi:hypothetical protein
MPSQFDRSRTGIVHFVHIGLIKIGLIKISAWCSLFRVKRPEHPTHRHVWCPHCCDQGDPHGNWRRLIMRKGLMVSVAAAALLAATGLASAQGMKGNEGGAATASPRGDAPAMAKPSAGTSMQKDTGAPARDAAQSDTKTGSEPKAATTAQEDKAGTKAMPQQAQQKSDSKATPQQAQQKSDTKASDTKASGDMANDSKSKSMDSKSTDTKASESGAANGTARPATADSKSGTDAKPSATTGNAATSATMAPPAEKRTQISSAIRQQKVEEVTNINFNISVGTRVPTSVHFYPVPQTVVEIYPEWRGYDFILVHGQYIILRPQTHEIVYIIEI